MATLRARKRTSHRVRQPALRQSGDRADEAGLSRRMFMTLLGAFGGLAACGPGVLGLHSAGGGEPGYLRWGNWPYYLDKAEDSESHPTIERFQEESGITVIYLENVFDNNGFLARVEEPLRRAQDINYDLVVLTGWMAARWERRGYTEPWGCAMIPNTRNLLPDLEWVSYDPGRTCSVPWQSGLTGIAWNKEKVSGGIRSIDDLWAPGLEGRVDLVTEIDDTTGLVLWSQGVDPSGDWGDDEFAAALDLVERRISDGQVLGVRDNVEYDRDLVSGTAWACVAYSGDVLQLNVLQLNLEARQGGAEEDPYGFAVPEYGGLLWSDNFLIPRMSGRQEEVQKFIDFYYDPHVAATVAAWVDYTTPVGGAQEAMVDIDPELAENEAIFPTTETLHRTAVFRTLDDAEDHRYSTDFARVTGT